MIGNILPRILFFRTILLFNERSKFEPLKFFLFQILFPFRSSFSSLLPYIMEYYESDEEEYPPLIIEIGSSNVVCGLGGDMVSFFSFRKKSHFIFVVFFLIFAPVILLGAKRV